MRSFKRKDESKTRKPKTRNLSLPNEIEDELVYENVNQVAISSRNFTKEENLDKLYENAMGFRHNFQQSHDDDDVFFDAKSNRSSIYRNNNRSSIYQDKLNDIQIDNEKIYENHEIY
jgi:hypothetical protein